MSSITLQHNEISTFLEENNVSIGDTLYESKESGGGCKALLFGDNSLSVVFPCSVHKMKTVVKEKVAAHISEDVHNNLSVLNSRIFELLGNLDMDTNTLSYEWNGGYYARARLIGNEERVFTRIYKNVDNEGQYEEIDIKDCPPSFEGYACFHIKGVYYTTFKGKGRKIHLVVELEEFIINKETPRGSKILQTLGIGKVINKTDLKKTVKDEDENLLW